MPATAPRWGPCRDSPQASRLLPVDAHGEGGGAAGQDEDERQRERAPHEERHGEGCEDDRQRPCERRRHAADADRPGDERAGREHDGEPEDELEQEPDAAHAARCRLIRRATPRRRPSRATEPRRGRAHRAPPGTADRARRGRRASPGAPARRRRAARAASGREGARGRSPGACGRRGRLHRRGRSARPA